MRVFVSSGVIAGDVRAGVSEPALGVHAATNIAVRRYEIVLVFID
jgi:hypothetical protein